jgi:hypothetical protein
MLTSLKSRADRFRLQGYHAWEERIRPDGYAEHVESILQVRAALLSDDDRLSKHLRRRPVLPVRRMYRTVEFQSSSGRLQ